jgi:hypothetical protein
LSSSSWRKYDPTSDLSLAGKRFSASHYGALRDWSKNRFSPQPLLFDIPHYNQEVGIKMNSNKRKEGPNDNDRAKGAKRNKVCGMVPFFYTNIFRRNSNLGARMIETFCCEIQGAFECMIHQAYPICWLSSPYSYFTSGPHFLPPSQLIVDPHLIFTLCLTSI